MEDKILCPVCHASLNSDDNSGSVITPCGHVYHKSCVTPWLRKSANCPMCKTKIQVNSLAPIFFDEPEESNSDQIVRNALYDEDGPRFSSESIKKIKFYDSESELVLADLKHVKHVAEDYLNNFIVIKDRNRNLQKDLESEIKLLDQTFSEQKSGSALKLQQLQQKASIELEKTRSIIDDLILKWKENIAAELIKVKAKNELVIKFEDCPRRYIKDSFTKSTRRLYLSDI
ncbi:hypothetical protein BY458DRAFT_491756 [Sporodiniella umbellata]|nr:hypothetical protein BY458DRAFT_491756 [Sporodiniella umbellata]